MRRHLPRPHAGKQGPFFSEGYASDRCPQVGYREPSGGPSLSREALRLVGAVWDSLFGWLSIDIAVVLNISQEFLGMNFKF